MLIKSKVSGKGVDEEAITIERGVLRDKEAVFSRELKKDDIKDRKEKGSESPKAEASGYTRKLHTEMTVPPRPVKILPVAVLYLTLILLIALVAIPTIIITKRLSLLNFDAYINTNLRTDLIGLVTLPIGIILVFLIFMAFKGATLYIMLIILRILANEFLKIKTEFTGGKLHSKPDLDDKTLYFFSMIIFVVIAVLAMRFIDNSYYDVLAQIFASEEYFSLPIIVIVGVITFFIFVEIIFELLKTLVNKEKLGFRDPARKLLDKIIAVIYASILAIIEFFEFIQSFFQSFKYLLNNEDTENQEPINKKILKI